jgi:hypothetical protein
MRAVLTDIYERFRQRSEGLSLIIRFRHIFIIIPRECSAFALCLDLGSVNPPTTLGECGPIPSLPLGGLVLPPKVEMRL